MGLILKAMYTIDDAIHQAIVEAEKKIASGKMAKPHTSDDEDGETVTLYTLAAIYGMDVEGKRFDEAVEIIESMLNHTFPEYV